MGIFQRLGLLPKHWAPPTPEELAEPLFDALDYQLQNLSVEELYRDQPHLRTVTDFIARSISSVSLHVYERAEDGGRVRVRDGQVPALMMRSSPSELMCDLLHGSIMDLCLYDEFIWYVTPALNGGDRHILRIPPTWVERKTFDSPWDLKRIDIRNRSTGRLISLDPVDVIWVHGYAPGTMKHGISPVQSLKNVLREQLESSEYRAQLWKNGPRIGGVITRPKDAKWDDKSRNRFRAMWRAHYTGNGSGAGGAPILEDGMDFKPMHLSADDEQLVDMTKLSLQTVASVYHVNPTMVGLLDNANYSNVREFRRSLYGDSLGPIIKRIELVINNFLLPMLLEDDGKYVEFNLEEKLRASFEEKAAVTSTAVGGPWMTVNEARAMNNMPAVEGGNDLIRPLNVGVAGESDAELEGDQS